MSDNISRQALCQYALNQKSKSVTPNDIMRFPSADPKRDDENEIKFFHVESIDDYWIGGVRIGNIKYVCRAGKKDPSKKIEDLQKAEWYLKRYIEMEKGD